MALSLRFRDVRYSKRISFPFLKSKRSGGKHLAAIACVRAELDHGMDVFEGTYSSAHSFSRRIWSSSSGVKSFWMLKVLRISSGDLPLIMLATVLHPTSRRALISR